MNFIDRLGVAVIATATVLGAAIFYGSLLVDLSVIGHFIGEPVVGRTRAGVTVRYSARRDEVFGGPGSIALDIRLCNASSDDLEDVELILDGQWRAPLSKLELLQLGMARSTSRISSGECVAVVLSHDVSNHGHFRDIGGSAYPADVLPTRLMLRSDAGTGEWILSPN